MKTRNRLTRAPQVLRKKLEALRARHAASGTTAELSEALAECCFRLAVDPGTSAEEALSLLGEACRVDGSNPKYAYHMARLLYGCGRLQAAAFWIRRACRHSPTSHRIWTHVSLLQHEMNALYYGDDRYEPDALRKRAEAIASAVYDGKDAPDPEWLDFVPPQSLAARERMERQGRREALGHPAASGEADLGRMELPAVPRLTGSGTCRWSGLQDLLVELGLEGSPSQRTLKRLLPLLTGVAARVGTKTGATAAFSILAVQWLVAGYPVTTVRRLMSRIPQEEADRPSVKMLTHVCSIFEAPEEQVPALIARGLQAGTIPPLLAAVLHHRRVLWRPLEFRNVGAYHRSKQLLAGCLNDAPDAERDGKPAAAKELVGKLRLAIEGLDPAPPAPLADATDGAPKQTLSPEDAVAAFLRAEEDSRTLEDLRGRAFAFLKDTVVVESGRAGDAAAFAQLAADREAVEAILEALPRAAQRGAERLRMAVDRIAAQGAAAAPEGFESRKDACDKRLGGFGNVGNFRKMLRRVDANLAEAAERPGEPPAALPSPSRELSDVLAAVNGCFADPPADAVPEAQSPEARLAALEDAAARLAALREAALVFLKESLAAGAGAAPSSPEWRQAVADRPLFDAAIAALEQAGRAGLTRLEEVLAACSEVEENRRPQALDSRKEACDKGLKSVLNLGNFVKILKRVDKQLAVDAPPESLPPPSAALADLLNSLHEAAWAFDDHGTVTAAEGRAAAVRQQVDGLDRRVEELLRMADPPDESVRGLLAECREASRTLSVLRASDAASDAGLDDVAARVDGFIERLSAVPAGPSRETSRGKPAAGRAGEAPPRAAFPELATLVQALAETEQCVRDAHARAFDSFLPYPDWVRELPPMQALQDSVLARYAEMLFRMRRRREARRVWTSLLRRDRLDVGVLKNIAVCDTGDADAGRALASWKSYLELLYFHDLVAGDLSINAELRAEFHRAYGDSYAPAAVFQNDDGIEKPGTLDPLLAFLESRGRLRHFAIHKSLEFLNRLLVYRSPALMLGVSRNDSEACRVEARKRLAEFAEPLMPYLPNRVRAGFADLLRLRLDGALKECAEYNRLLRRRDTAYPEEEERHQKMLVEMAQLKIRLFSGIRDNPHFVAEMASVDFLLELRRLDAIPLDLSGHFLSVTAGSVRADEEVVRETMKHLGDAVVYDLLKFLYGENDDDLVKAQRLQQYQRLEKYWVHRPALKEYLRPLDNPGSGYPRPILEALQAGDFREDVVRQLREWHEMFPGVSGVACELASILHQQGHTEEAIRVLEDTAQRGLLEEGRKTCRGMALRLRAKHSVDHEQYGEATRCCLDLMELDDRDVQVPKQAIFVFVEAARNTGKDHGCQQLMNAVDAWISRARQRLALPKPDTPEEGPTPTEADLADLREFCNDGVAELIMALWGVSAKHPNFQKAESSLNQLLQRYPDHLHGRFCRMVLRHQMAAQLSRSGSGIGDIKSLLQDARDDAEFVLRNAPDPQLRLQAERVLADIRRVT